MPPPPPIAGAAGPCHQAWLFHSFETLIFLPSLLDARIEEFVYEKLDRKAPSRVNNPELLGQYMIDAGTEFGPGTAYGKSR